MGPKKQDFGQIIKGNNCILRIQGAQVCQKLGMILEMKMFKKLKLEITFLPEHGFLNWYSQMILF